MFQERLSVPGGAEGSENFNERSAALSDLPQSECAREACSVAQDAILCHGIWV